MGLHDAQPLQNFLTNSPYLKFYAMATPRRRHRILSQLKLGKQATGYKTAQKVLNRFIAELIGSV
ncbi:MAG: hypothetical protein V7K77_14520 [Nostoc sp.]